MTDSRSHPVAPVLIALTVTVLWSSSWLLIRVGLDDEELRPLGFAALRYGLAATLLLIVAVARPTHRRQLLTLSPGRRRHLAVFGLVHVAVTQAAQFVAIDSQPAATSSLMLAPTALVVAVVGGRSIGESVTVRQVVGATLLVVGALVYLAGDLGATWIGMIASVIGLAANSAGALIGRAVNRSGLQSALVVTAVSMAVGAAALTVTALVVEGVPTVTGRALAIVGWLAVVNTALAFTLWNRAQRDLTAIETAAINNTMLVQIALIAWVGLGESPGPWGVLGIVVVSVGAYVAQARRAPRPVTPGG